jgi:hypothetical protein
VPPGIPMRAYKVPAADDWIPWFQSHPEVVDRLQSVLTKFYLAGEGPEWRAIWAILERFADPPVDRCQALAVVLQDFVVSTKLH